MKIRELFEEAKAPQLELVFYFPKTELPNFSDIPHQNQSFRSTIFAAVKSVIGGLKFSLSNITVDSFNVVIGTPTWDLAGSAAQQRELIAKIAKAVGDKFEVKLRPQAGKEFYSVMYGTDLPALPVEAISAFFLTCAGPTSLSAIHKLVKAPELQIFKADNITDSILGLLKFKDIKIFDYQKSSKSKVWYKLLQKHYPGRDVLGLQDELIEAGLKEFAKL